MKVYKIEGHLHCNTCQEYADYYIDLLDISLCKKCAVELYKQLGTKFIPRAVPNIILRDEERYKSLSEAVINANQIKSTDDKSDNIRRNKWQSFKTNLSKKSLKTSKKDRKQDAPLN